jgi:hypothetical protein
MRMANNEAGGDLLLELKRQAVLVVGALGVVAALHGLRVLGVAVVFIVVAVAVVVVVE